MRFSMIASCFAALLAAGLASGQSSQGFDIASLDRSADPCVNFYKFSCGGWMKANPLPGDQARYGTFDQLRDRNRTVLRTMLEAASVDKPGRNAIDQKIGDFYYACMDEKGIDARGTAPLKPDLDRIAALKNKKDLADLVAILHRGGTAEFFNFSSEQDPKDSAQEIAGLDQGGLGLPDRDYYLKTDQKSVEQRNAYVAHVAKMFELLGSSPTDAAKKAQVVMAIETALANGSFDLVTRRDPEKVYHKMTVKDLAMLGPDFDWARFIKAVGAPPIQSLDVAVPPFVKALDDVIAKNSLDDLKTYLIWHLVNSNTEVLPTTFQQENFNFYGEVLSGTKEMRPRWKRCVDLTDS
jgi:putative endopeptidase